MGGWVCGLAYLHFLYFLGDRSNFKKYYFQIVLSKLGKRYFFSVAQRSKLDFKIDTFCQVDTCILNMLEIKNRFLDFFKVVLELLRKYLERDYFLVLKGLQFICLFSSIGSYMTSKIDIFGQISTHFFVRVTLDHLGIKKVVFWTSKLFLSCFRNV